MQDLPGDLRVIAIDLRGFGESEHAPVDDEHVEALLADPRGHVRGLASLGVERAHDDHWLPGTSRDVVSHTSP